MSKIIPFIDLPSSDLIIDAIYEGDTTGRIEGDALSNLLPGVGNQGGFRAAGKGDIKKFVVLFTTGDDRDWPDFLNLNTGQFTYFGDNKKPGHELHDTQRGGNRILRAVFNHLHSNNRSSIPPFFVFQKYPTPKSSRSVQFKGIAVPGFAGVPATEDLVAVWKTTNQMRFQNYKAIFTIINIPVVPRRWLNELKDLSTSKEAPKTWVKWVKNGRYDALSSEPTTIIRTIDQQIPDTELKIEILKLVWNSFRETPAAFEVFAAKIFQMHDKRVIIDEITRSTIDGGRDAIGRYILGLTNDPVFAEFSLEAKCYKPNFDNESANSVGVKEVSRLISRIRHRQFGVLVTTSFVARQAYEEVRTDRHPIIFISGRDLAEILIENGYNTLELVKQLIDDQHSD